MTISADSAASLPVKLFSVEAPHAAFFFLLDAFGRAAKKYGAALALDRGRSGNEREAMLDAREHIVMAMVDGSFELLAVAMADPDVIELKDDSSLRRDDWGWAFYRGESEMRRLSVFEEEHILAAYRAGRSAGALAGAVSVA